MDPPIPFGKYLGCEHHVTEKWINWQGEDPTVLDPPPPKTPKGEQVEDASTGPRDPVQAAAAGMLPVYCDRSYPVPDGQDVWARYDPSAKRLRMTLENRNPRGTRFGDAPRWTMTRGKNWMT